MFKLFKKLNLLLDLLLEDREERRIEKQRMEMAEYARKSLRKEPESIVSTVENEEELVKTKAKILIPFGLSYGERTILKDFYRNNG